MKGQAFKGFMGAVEQLFTAEAARRVVEALPHEARNSWQYGGLVAGGWYPVAWYRGFQAAAHAVLAKEPRLSQRISYEATRADLQGVYRFVLKFVSPRVLIGQVDRIMSMYVRGGRSIVRDSDDSAVTLHFDEFFGYDSNIWQDTIGGIEATLETTGVKVVSTTVVEGGGDEPRMVCRVRWE